ncbi:MAG: hypothetical protein QM535_02265 [Limnohabitans sp.]|nr:hypothetical protein [Limnohabitans sp.]
MKVAVMTSLLAEGYVDVDGAHFLVFRRLVFSVQYFSGQYSGD